MNCTSNYGGVLKTVKNEDIHKFLIICTKQAIENNFYWFIVTRNQTDWTSTSSGLVGHDSLPQLSMNRVLERLVEHKSFNSSWLHFDIFMSKEPNRIIRFSIGYKLQEQFSVNGKLRSHFSMYFVWGMHKHCKIVDNRILACKPADWDGRNKDITPIFTIMLQQCTWANETMVQMHLGINLANYTRSNQTTILPVNGTQTLPQTCRSELTLLKTTAAKHSPKDLKSRKISFVRGYRTSRFWEMRFWRSSF